MWHSKKQKNMYLKNEVFKCKKKNGVVSKVFGAKVK
jgi:hypothetical protein